MSRSDAVRAPSEGVFFAEACAGVAFVVPFAFAAWRLRSAPTWRDDLALIQGLGLVPAGGEGGPSALVAALFSLLPVGGRVFRTGLVSAFGAGIAGRALFGFARSSLLRSGASARFAAFLAVTAALAATSSTIWQREAIGPGGVTLAAGLCFVALALADARRPWGPAFGIVTGLAFAESRLAGGAIVVALAARALVEIVVTPATPAAVPSRRDVVETAFAALATWGFFFLPVLVRPLAAHASIDLGSGAVAAFTSTAARAVGPALLVRWEASLGPFALLLAALGVARAVIKRSVAVRLPPLVVFVLFGVWAAKEPAGGLARDPGAPLLLLATGALCVAGALGVEAVIAVLRRARLPFRTPAAVLLVVFHVTTVFAAIETSSLDPALSSDVAAEVWSDEALAELPPNALVLARSPAIALRVWAGHLARGERPDLVVVPFDWIGQPAVARDVLGREPAASALVRDVAMTGKTTEYALSTLADARPLFVELRPEWDYRLFEHLSTTPLWLGFSAHPLGRSDRTAAVLSESGRRALRRILKSAKDDPATRSVITQAAEQEALVLASLGDAESVHFVLADIERMEPDSPFPSELKERAERRRRNGPIALLK